MWQAGAQVVRLQGQPQRPRQAQGGKGLCAEVAEEPWDPTEGLWGGTAVADLEGVSPVVTGWLPGSARNKTKPSVSCVSDPFVGMEMGCPPVEDLARWLANDEWLPKPVNGGAARTELTDEEVAWSVWAEMPVGLRAWRLRSEPTMWKGGELLLNVKSVIGRCVMPSGVADLHTDGESCTCGVAGAAEQSRPTGVATGCGMADGEGNDRCAAKAGRIVR